MIASNKKAELLKDRSESLKSLRVLIERARNTTPGAKREEIWDAAKKLGKIAEWEKRVIEACDRGGWENYYEIKKPYNDEITSIFHGFRQQSGRLSKSEVLNPGVDQQ